MTAQPRQENDEVAEIEKRHEADEAFRTSDFSAYMRHAGLDAHLDRATLLRLLKSRQPPVLPSGSHPEDTCEKCHGPNVVWFAANALWNSVMRDAAGDDKYQIVCPICFINEAEAKGINPPAWQVIEEVIENETPPVPLTEQERENYAATLDAKDIVDNVVECPRLFVASLQAVARYARELESRLSGTPKLELTHEEHAWRLRFVNLLEQIEAWHANNNGEFIQAWLYCKQLMDAANETQVIIDRLTSSKRGNG